MNLTDPEQLYAAIRALPVSKRLQLVERVVHDVATSEPASPSAVPALLGLMADDPDLVDEVFALASDARAKARLRNTHG